MTTSFEVEIRNHRLCILKDGYVIFDNLLVNIESISLHDKNNLIINSMVNGVKPKLLGTDHEEARILTDKISEHIMNYSLLQDLLLKVNDGTIIPLSDILCIYTVDIKDGNNPPESGQNIIIKRKSVVSPHVYGFDANKSSSAEDFYTKLDYVFKLWKRMMLRFEYGNHDVYDLEKQLTITTE